MPTTRNEAKTSDRPEPAAGGRSPQQTMTLFVNCVHAGDLDGLIALYEPDAVLQPSTGDVFTGSEAIRGYLAQLLAMKPTMDVVPADVLQAGDTALVVNEWSMRGTAPDGSTIEGGGRSADVLRRQPDGGWLVLIDHP